MGLKAIFLNITFFSWAQGECPPRKYDHEHRDEESFCWKFASPWQEKTGSRFGSLRLEYIRTKKKSLTITYNTRSHLLFYQQPSKICINARSYVFELSLKSFFSLCFNFIAAQKLALNLWGVRSCSNITSSKNFRTPNPPQHTHTHTKVKSSLQKSKTLTDLFSTKH